MNDMEIPGLGTLTHFGALLIGEYAVIADLHIGYEYDVGRGGTALPDLVLPAVLNTLKSLKEAYSPELLVIAGDLKHSFSKESGSGWKAIDIALNGISDMFTEVHIVRGNHDNYLLNHIKGSKCENIVWHGDHIILNGIRIIHGHGEAPDGDGWLVMGHEHPAVVLSDEFAVKKRFPSYIILDNARILVLPSFNRFMPGVDVDELLSGVALSPVLRGKKWPASRLVAITEEGLIAPF